MRYRIRSLDGAVVELGEENGEWVAGGDDPVRDLSHLWSLPGLVDAHIHMSSDVSDFEPASPDYVRARAFTEVSGGVFLCFDKGWNDEVVLQLMDDPLDRRPTLQAAGRIIAGPGGYYPDSVIEVDPSDLAEQVRAVLGPGGWVKLIGDWPRKGVGAVPSFTESELRAAVDVAHAAGARVAIHTMAPETPSLAVRAGIDSIEHGLFLTDDDVRILGARGGCWVPTVRQVERIIDQVGRERTGGRMLAEGLDRVRSLASAATEAGVVVLTGSDFGTTQGRIGEEAVGLTEYGFGPGEAVAAVSENGFLYAGEKAGFEPGLPADVVAFASHPTEVIETLLDPVVVIRRGEELRDRTGA